MYCGTCLSAFFCQLFAPKSQLLVVSVAKMPTDRAAIARIKDAADGAERKQGLMDIADPKVKEMIGVIEAFLRGRHRICYGGTAINNLLPAHARFYDPATDIPDYDFLSPDVLRDGIDLGEVFKSQLGYESVELRQGVHLGTYKLFVDYRGIADITQTDPRFYDALMHEAIEVDGIMYANPNYLRMSMYLEMSRPNGDVSRWTKVYQRLQLLNKYRPLEMPAGECARSPGADYATPLFPTEKSTARKIHSVLLPHIMRKGYVMLGAHTLLFYQHWNTPGEDVLDKLRNAVPSYIILSEDYGATTLEIAGLLRDMFGATPGDRSGSKGAGAKAVKVVSHPRLNELISPHREITVFGERVLFVYQTIACHSYYALPIGKSQTLRIATMDTMLSLYLSFVMSERTYYQRTALLCMAQYMIDRVAHLRSMSRPPLPPISLQCIGHQHTLRDIMRDKEVRFKKLDRGERLQIAIRPVKDEDAIKWTGPLEELFSLDNPVALVERVDPKLAERVTKALAKKKAAKAATKKRATKVVKKIRTTQKKLRSG